MAAADGCKVKRPCQGSLAPIPGQGALVPATPTVKRCFTERWSKQRYLPSVPFTQRPRQAGKGTKGARVKIGKAVRAERVQMSLIGPYWQDAFCCLRKTRIPSAESSPGRRTATGRPAA